MAAPLASPVSRRPAFLSRRTHENVRLLGLAVLEAAALGLLSLAGLG